MGVVNAESCGADIFIRYVHEQTFPVTSFPDLPQLCVACSTEKKVFPYCKRQKAGGRDYTFPVIDIGGGGGGGGGGGERNMGFYVSSTCGNIIFSTLSQPPTPVMKGLHAPCVAVYFLHLVLTFTPHYIITGVYCFTCCRRFSTADIPSDSDEDLADWLIKLYQEKVSDVSPTDDQKDDKSH